MVPVDDHLVLPEDRARTIAMYAGKHTGILLPLLLPFKIICRHVHSVTIQETDKDVFAVRDRGGRGQAVTPVNTLPGGSQHRRHPLPLPAAPVQADQFPPILHRGDDKDVVLPDNGGSMPLPGQGYLPDRIALHIPIEGHNLVRARSITTGPPPRRPGFFPPGRGDRTETSGKANKKVPFATPAVQRDCRLDVRMLS